MQGAGGLQVLRWADGDVAVEPVGLSAPATWSGIGFDVADLTGDGRRDIAMLEGAGVAIHAQEPDGSWAAPVTVDLPGLDTSALSKALATSDLDGDGRADIVVTSAWNAGSWGGAGARLAYTTQQPDASFGPLTVLATQGGGPGALKIGDVTADGRADVAVLHNGGDVGVFRQTAAGTLAAEHPMDGASATTFFSPDSLGIGDLDGDGVGDLAVAGYNVGLSLFTHQAAAAVEGAGPWVAATSPAEHATGVATTVRPSVTFGRDVAPSSVNANTVALIDGRDGHVVPTTLARSGRTVTLTPAARLQAGAPYVVWVAGVTDPTGAEFAYEQVPFTTVGAASPRYDITRTLRPFRIDLDGNGFDDIFWYAPGDAVDSIWFHGTDGRVGVNTQVIGTYTPLAGDFDGNGYDDVFWYGPGSGTDVMWWNSRRHPVRGGSRARRLRPPRGRFRPQRLRRHLLVRAGDRARLGVVLRSHRAAGRGAERDRGPATGRPRATSTVTGTTTSCGTRPAPVPRACGGAGPAGSPRARPCRSPGPTAPSRSTTTQTGSRRCSCTRRTGASSGSPARRASRRC